MSPAAPIIEYVSDEADHVLVSLNPRAGYRSRKQQVQRLAAKLKDDGWNVVVSSDLEEVRRLSAEWGAERKLRALVAAGGDGTVALLANESPPGTPLGVLPLGTENLLSKYLGAASGPAELADIIRQGAFVRMDAGQADGRLFLLMLSCGFDAEVVRRLHGDRTGHIHHFSYAKPILDSIRTYQYPEVRVHCESSEGVRCIEARWAFVVNLPRYAIGLKIAPDAIGTDGQLDLCTFKAGSLLSGLRYLTGVILGQHRSWNDCVSCRGLRFRIESDEMVPYQLDGDPGGYLPVEIEVLPARLSLLVSSNWAAVNGFAGV